MLHLSPGAAGCAAELLSQERQATQASKATQATESDCNEGKMNFFLIGFGCCWLWGLLVFISGCLSERNREVKLC